MQNNSFKWFSEIRNILISCGNVGFWDNLNFPNNKWLNQPNKNILISTLMTGKTNVKIIHLVVHIEFLKHVLDLKII